MAPRDLWHYRYEKAARKAGVTESCACKGTRYPTKRHGEGLQWRVSIPGHGDQHFGTKGEGEVYERKIKGDLDKGIKPFDTSRGLIVFGDDARAWVRRHYHDDPNSRRTVMGRLECHLIPWFENKRWCDIENSSTAILDWLDWMRTKPKLCGEGPLSENTVESVWVLFNSLLEAAVVDEKIRVNPLRKLKASRPKRTYQAITEADIWDKSIADALLDATPEKYRPIPLLAVACGHRQAEAFAVAKDDIEFLRRKITIRHQVAVSDNGELYLKPPKWNSVRTGSLPPVVGETLAQHLEKYPTLTVRCTCCRRKSHELLVHDGGQMLKAATWNRTVWHPTVAKAGLSGTDEEIGLHWLRHLWVSLLIDGGADVVKVSKAAGHRTETTTLRIYTHLLNKSDNTTMDIIQNAFGGRRWNQDKDQDKGKEANHG